MRGFGRYVRFDNIGESKDNREYDGQKPDNNRDVLQTSKLVVEIIKNDGENPSALRDQENLSGTLFDHPENY